MTIGSKVKQTLAELKGVHGALQMYSAITRDGESKAVYEKAKEEIGEIIGDLEERVRTLEFQEPQYKGK